jgi:hypothetical protein
MPRHGGDEARAATDWKVEIGRPAIRGAEIFGGGDDATQTQTKRASVACVTPQI